MYKIFILLTKFVGVAFISALLASCSEEVEVNTIGPPVNIVYCLLNPGEDIQYVRIGRSYTGNNNSYLNSPVSDSISWNKNMSVYIEEWSADATIQNVFYFLPENEIVKDTGFFPVEGLAIFKSEFRPKPSLTYAIYVHFPDDDRISNARITIPGDVVVHDPKPVPLRKINLQSGSAYTLRWEPVKNAGVYQSFFKIIYEENTVDGIGLDDISFNSQIFTEFSSSQLIEKTISGSRFFEECLSQVDSTVEAVRRIVNVSFEMYIGGEEFGLFLFSQMEGNYLSSAFSDYNNIENGLGLFSSLSIYKVSNMQLSNTTLDELAYSDKTRKLGFLDHYGKR